MPTTTATYTVQDEDDVAVDVLIGDAQPGGSTILLGTTILKSGGDTLTGVRVGKGRDIRALKLIVSSAVTDANEQTDRTSTRVTVKGGAAPRVIEQSQTAPKKGAIVSYITVVTFV